MFERFKLEKRISELDDRVSKLEQWRTGMDIQWLDTLDRLKRMMGRVLKERQRAEAAGEPFYSDPEAEEEVGTSQSGLSPKQRQIQAQILARRNRLGREQ